MADGFWLQKCVRGYKEGYNGEFRFGRPVGQQVAEKPVEVTDKFPSFGKLNAVTALDESQAARA